RTYVLKQHLIVVNGEVGTRRLRQAIEPSDAGIAQAADLHGAGRGPVRLPQADMVVRVEASEQHLAVELREIGVFDTSFPEQPAVLRGIGAVDGGVAEAADLGRAS